MGRNKIIRLACVVTGLGLISYGLWQYDPRWGMISCGLGLFLLGIGVI